MPQPPAIFDHLGWRIAAIVLCCALGFAIPYLALSGFAQSAHEPSLPSTSSPTSSPERVVAQPTTPATSATSAPAVATHSTPSATVTAALSDATEACRLANLRVETALSAAQVSLAQFDKHIDAMNLLVAGKISYAVATQFWDETRVGATQNIAQFDRLERTVTSAKSACKGLPAPAVDELPYGQVQRLNQCVSHVGRGRAALASAHVAVTTWRHHVHDMEMLRTGRITPAQATAAWQKNWHTGAKQLQKFETAQRAAEHVRCTLT